MLTLKAGALLCASCVLAVGCDPVRTTRQPILLKVTDSASGEPVADTDVSLKYDFDHYVPKPDEWNEWKRATYRWFSGKTNVSGQAEVGIAWTMLDSTWGPTPPSWRDQVTGIVYLIRLKKDQAHEEHSLIMWPGISVHGETFTVHVLEIGPPRYVKTDE